MTVVDTVEMSHSATYTPSKCDMQVTNTSTEGEEKEDIVFQIDDKDCTAEPCMKVESSSLNIEDKELKAKAELLFPEVELCHRDGKRYIHCKACKTDIFVDARKLLYTFRQHLLTPKHKLMADKSGNSCGALDELEK